MSVRFEQLTPKFVSLRLPESIQDGPPAGFQLALLGRDNLLFVFLTLLANLVASPILDATLLAVVISRSFRQLPECGFKRLGSRLVRL